MRYHQYPVRPKPLHPYTPRARRGGIAIPSIPRSAKTFASLYSKGAKRGNCNTINTPFGQNLCILILQGCGEGGMRYHQYPVRPKTLLPYTPRARRGGNAIPSIPRSAKTFASLYSKGAKRGNCNTINTPFGQNLCILILQGCGEGGMRYHQYPVRPKTLLPYTPRARRGGNAIPSIPRSAKNFASLYSKGAERGECDTINTPFGQILCFLILQGRGEAELQYHQYPVRPKTLLPYTPRARRGGNAIPSIPRSAKNFASLYSKGAERGECDTINTPFGIYAVRKNNYQY